ncbi:MAG: hypothetical protein II908_08090 [Bacteroidaceae bacterium]|nr:hypothetical protein [Bacteroidaceae bacterium]
MTGILGADGGDAFCNKTPGVFVDFIANWVVATQMDLLRLLNDGGVKGSVSGGVIGIQNS